MKSILKNIFSLIFCLVITNILVSCHQDEPNDSPFVDPSQPAESTILIYAVATNSLKSNLVYDKNEILSVASEIDLKKNNILIFQTAYKIDTVSNKFTGESEISLIKLVGNGKDYDWKIEKKYDDDIAVLNPIRISEVIDYVTETYPAETYGLIFWSHSTGPQPYLPGIEIPASNSPMTYSFGQDQTTSQHEFEQINIDRLARALPDNLFNYIWFDSCYMSNIESIYQLRNKCDTYIGYATEVCDVGNPYHKVIPYLAKKNPDIEEAAKAFFNYYDKEYIYRIATIAVTDMNKIERLADFCREVYEPLNLISFYTLHEYTRSTVGPFYDLGDYTKALAKQGGIEISNEEWSSLLDECLLYRAATEYDFSGKRIEPETYSGISTHVYDFEYLTEIEKYYQSLDWFKSVF